MAHKRRALCTAATAAATIIAWSGPLRAEVLHEDELEETSTELGVVMRSFAFLLAGDVLEPPLSLEDQNPTGRGLFDARLYFSYRTPELKLVAHQQLTLSLSSQPAGGLLGLGRGLSPPRWLPLNFSHNEDHLTLQSNMDWLYGAATFGPVTITLGRQPVTFGRGALWRTTDRISTFALTEVDTTYKPGSDALRIDISPSDRTTLSMLAAIGELESQEVDAEASLRGSSFMGRFKQGFDGGEIGATAGFIRYDALVGLDATFDLGSFDVYGEVAATWVTEDSLTTPAKQDARGIPVISAVAGMTLKPVAPLTLKPELHYNGFGSFDSADYLAVAVSERVGIGEQIALGRVYAGLTSDWEIAPLTHLAGATLVNLHDPSALWSLALVHSLAQNVDLIAGGYVPVGLRPDPIALTARSEYGNYPYFFFTELRTTL